MSYPAGPPWPDTEWDEIVPGLWQGGHVYKVLGSPFETKLVGVRTFDYVVSLYSVPWRKDTMPDDDIAHAVFEIYDDSAVGVLPEDEERIHELVDSIVEAMDMGQTVLVRCQAGYNRSGLVAGLVLMRRGMPAPAAIALLREKRSSWVLCNRAFEAYLLNREENASAAVRDAATSPAE